MSFSMTPGLSSIVRKDADSMLTCAVCMEAFKSPKILTCQHTFCLPCLENCLEAAQKLRPVRLSNLPCPTCRKICYLPSQGLEGLPTDFKVTQLRDLMEKIGAGRNDEHSDEIAIDCSICQFRGIRRSAIMHCTQCSKNLCDTCSIQHSGNPLFSSHVTKPIERVPVNVGLTPPKCREHKESLLYFCEQCEGPVCTVCVMTGHSKHSVHDMTKSRQIQKRILDKKSMMLAGCPSKLEDKRRSLALIMTEQEAVVQRSKESIRSASEAAKRAIDDVMVDLLSQLDTYHTRLSTEIADFDEKLASNRTAAEELNDKLRSFIDDSSGDGIECKEFLTLNNDVRRISGLLRDTEEIRDSFRHCIIFEPDSYRKTKLGVLIDAQLTEAAQKIKSFESHIVNEEHVETSMRSSVASSNPSPLSTTVVVDDVDTSTITTTRKIDGFKRCRSVCFTSSGDLIATDYVDSGDKVKIFNTRSGELLKKLNSAMVVRPWAACYDDYSCAIVISDHGHSPLKILTPSLSTNDISMLRCGMLRATGIAATRQGEYVVTDTGGGGVSGATPISAVYAQLPMGKIAKLFEFGAEGDGKLICPNFAVVDDQDRIIVSDCGSKDVKIFSSAGKLVSKFNVLGDDRQPAVFQGLAIDENNNILLADQTSSKILRLSSEGRLIETVVENVEKPWGIGYYRDGRILAIATELAVSIHHI